jgi:hypothetical protein
MTTPTNTTHPADHPVFANMPETQARLRATVPTRVEGKRLTSESGNQFTVTNVDAPAIHFSRFTERDGGVDFTNLALHGVTSVKVIHKGGKVAAVSIITGTGEVVAIDIYHAE